MLIELDRTKRINNMTNGQIVTLYQNILGAIRTGDCDGSCPLYKKCKYKNPDVDRCEDLAEDYLFGEINIRLSKIKSRADFIDAINDYNKFQYDQEDKINLYKNLSWLKFINWLLRPVENDF